MSNRADAPLEKLRQRLRPKSARRMTSMRAMKKNHMVWPPGSRSYTV
jgi:hypothetical protein